MKLAFTPARLRGSSTANQSAVNPQNTFKSADKSLSGSGPGIRFEPDDLVPAGFPTRFFSADLGFGLFLGQSQGIVAKVVAMVILNLAHIPSPSRSSSAAPDLSRQQFLDLTELVFY